MDDLLAIDIQDDVVSGVLLESGTKVAVVRGYGVVSMQGASLAEALAEIVRQTGFEEGDCRVSIGAGKFFFRNLVLPFADTRTVEKVLPFELEELTSYKIDDLHLDFLPSAPVSNDDGMEIVAAMIERDYFAETLAVFSAQGLDPEIFAVSGLQTAASLVSTEGEIRTFVVLDIGFRQTTLVLVNDGKIGVIRSLAVDAERMAGFTLSLTDAKVSVENSVRIPEIVHRLILQVEQTLISVGRSDLFELGAPCFISGGVGLYPAVFELLKNELALEVQPCNIAKQPLLKIEPSSELPWNPAIMNRALALATWKRKGFSIFNFRRGAFRKQYSLKNLREMAITFAIPLGLICVGLFGFFWWEYSNLEQRRDALHDEIVAVFQETLPEVTRLVNPVQQLQVKIDETRNMYSSGNQKRGNLNKLALLSELSSRIPQTLPIRITRLVADQNDVRIKAETSDFNTVDNVKRVLEKSGLFRAVIISSANLAPKGGEVRFELKLELR